MKRLGDRKLSKTISVALNGNVRHTDTPVDGYISFVIYVNDHKNEILELIQNCKPSDAFKVQFGGYIEFEDVNGDRK